MLVLYPVTSLNLLIKFTVTWCSIYGFTYINTIMLLANKENFTFFFSVLMYFISFYCLISLSRTPTTLLNKTLKSRYPCLITNMKRNVLKISLLNILTLVYYVWYSLCWDTFFSIPNSFRLFFTNRCLNCVKCFFLCWYDLIIF